MTTLRWLFQFGVITVGILPVSAAWADGATVQSTSDAVEILNPGEIVPPLDYPVSSWRAGEEGSVTVKLTVDAAAVLQNCQVTASSGYKELDDQTCRSAGLHGKFRVSGKSNEPDGRFSVTTKVRWAIPTGGPRALFLGVTLVSSSPGFNKRVHCSFSDGRVLFVPEGTPCVLNLPKQTITKAGRNQSVNIVDYYLYLYGLDPKPSYAFDVAVILATYQYAQSLDYLAKASDGGLGLASLAMCGTYASPRNYYRDLYDPQEAVRRCLLADHQGLGLGVILIQQFLAQHPEAATEEQQKYIKAHSATMPIYTSGAVMTISSKDLMRTQDYPKDALKQNIQGRTVALFRVNDHGRVEGCLIIQSSLSFALDDTVCRRLSDAAIYTPATTFGQPTESWTTQAVNWQIGKNSNGLGSVLFGALVGALIGHAIP